MIRKEWVEGLAKGRKKRKESGGEETEDKGLILVSKYVYTSD